MQEYGVLGTLLYDRSDSCVHILGFMSDLFQTLSWVCLIYTPVAILMDRISRHRQKNCGMSSMGARVEVPSVLYTVDGFLVRCPRNPFTAKYFELGMNISIKSKVSFQKRAGCFLEVKGETLRLVPSPCIRVSWDLIHK